MVVKWKRKWIISPKGYNLSLAHFVFLTTTTSKNYTIPTNGPENTNSNFRLKLVEKKLLVTLSVFNLSISSLLSILGLWEANEFDERGRGVEVCRRLAAPDIRIQCKVSMGRSSSIFLPPPQNTKHSQAILPSISSAVHLADRRVKNWQFYEWNVLLFLWFGEKTHFDC